MTNRHQTVGWTDGQMDGQTDMIVKIVWMLSSQAKPHLLAAAGASMGTGMGANAGTGTGAGAGTGVEAGAVGGA